MHRGIGRICNSNPYSFDSAHAAPLFCPGITAYKVVKASESATGKTIGIFGIGGVGHLTIQIAKIYGARVVATSRTRKHIDLSEKIGADNVVPYQENEEDFLKNLIMKKAFLTVQLSLHHRIRS